ncbi:MAG: hydroxyacylglutathione hydrolase [Henriciella sp.]|jgi:hydroxyacylglutathione hydrolase|uniref:hydroxyacylglutathione hydrolase n=1 Tax=Henriciella sp. TaxID=1968823 RepID=UPI000C0EDCC4|nr:hydroxyacylglutathione hydrolase [Henriciella sp.]MAN74002.1 hydroxyacylglutathione hydrolase [Henriciella sp.]MBF35269.1 hydroxyacylglutathione hydrolase [Hyphomonadaceae bacterium]PHR69793.1 MAG: hydroxyacylglutathione hydrolase [Henriciella sp.]|tara:strand:+ start:3622 stop:4383 length:762 start_codon:yes stop_codon:yes gene_type:complete
MIEIHQFPCLKDNYGFLAHDPESGTTVAIDTPDGEKYLIEASNRGWTIDEIWNTHWHPDHAGGNELIKKETGCRILGPAGEAEKIPGIDQDLSGGDEIGLGDMKVNIIDVPGHTLGHIAYHIPSAKTAFVGDALFALGCGRVFEGDADMMWKSLSRLKALPADTTIYCAHEYTQANARFALSVDPDNPALTAYAKEVEAKRSRGDWTVPTVLSRELEANPFLRADDADLQAAMGHAGDPVATFAEIRARKDSF